MTSSGLDIPNYFHFTFSKTYKAIPTADHGVLLGRYEEHLLPDFQSSSRFDPENGVITVHRLH